MITVVVYGLDQFVVGEMSTEATRMLAKLYEVSEDEINFVAPNNMVFHNGMEQTSWNVLVEMHVPMKLSVLQEEASEIIFSLLHETAIHVAITYHYFSVDHYVERINKDYPRYMENDNIVGIENEEYSEDMEEGEGEDDIYTGDIFEDFSHHHHHD